MNFMINPAYATYRGGTGLIQKQMYSMKIPATLILLNGQIDIDKTAQQIDYAGITAIYDLPESDVLLRKFLY